MSETRNPIRLAAGLLVATVILSGVGLGMGTGAAQAADAPALLQQIATPTPTRSGQINLPTTTATLVGGPSATPSRTPTITPVLAEMAGNPTNLRSGPGLDFDIIATLDQGTQLPLIGRWLGYDWYLVRWEDAPEGQAWVYAPLVLVIGDITTVPAVEPPQLPTIDPTVAAIQATATVLLQTPGAAETATATAAMVPTGIYTITPGGPQVVGGLPTFTPPPEVGNPGVATLPDGNDQQGIIPPAVVIISLGAMGLLMLAVGLLRRL